MRSFFSNKNTTFNIYNYEIYVSASAKPEISRNAEKAVLDKGIIIAAMILLVILFYSFYFDNLIDLLNF